MEWHFGLVVRHYAKTCSSQNSCHLWRSTQWTPVWTLLLWLKIGLQVLSSPLSALKQGTTVTVAPYHHLSGVVSHYNLTHKNEDIAVSHFNLCFPWMSIISETNPFHYLVVICISSLVSLRVLATLNQFFLYLWTFPEFFAYSGYIICQVINCRRILQAFGLPFPSDERGSFWYRYIY